MASRNPAFSEKAFQRARDESLTAHGSMTVNGSIQKTLLLILIAAVTGSYTWNQHFAGQDVSAWVIGGIIGGLIAALVTIFKPKVAHVSAPIYAALEGLALGGISAVYNTAYEGLPAQAILLTVSVLVVMLFLYVARIIRVTQRLRTGIIAATGAIFLVYILSFILSLFGVQMPLIHESSALGIGFSLVVVGIAAFNLLLDFDFIERGANGGLPKRYEWFGAFGLMVTLVWLYLEILRLLGKLRD